MTTEWKVGDKLRVLDNTKILRGEMLENGMCYEVMALDTEGLPFIHTQDSFWFEFLAEEMPYVSRVSDTVFTEDYEDTTARNAELGEPSAECNYEALTDIREELTDIKSMIGRLLQREQAEVDTLYAQRLNDANFATGADLAEKASAVIDGEESE